MENENKLYIPYGIKTRKEIFNGFSTEELVKSSIVIAICGGIDVVIWLVTRNTFLCMSLLMVSMIISVAMFTKDSYLNISPVEQIKFMIRYSNSQKKYPYKMLDEWGVNK